MSLFIKSSRLPLSNIIQQRTRVFFRIRPFDINLVRENILCFFFFFFFK
jgi:hypothetical protein